MASVLATLTCPAAGLLPYPALAAHDARDSPAALADLSLEELLQVEVRVASRIPTTALDAASSVDVLPEAAWQRRGARSVSEALAPIPGIAVTPALGGADAFAIRGYTRTTSLLGVLVSFDGVPLNDLFRGAPTLNVPSVGLGTIDEIELIEGPGSALYGADAFHGVVALHGYDATADERTLEADLRSNGAYAATGRVSAGLRERARLSLAATVDGQPSQNLSYRYDDPATGALQTSERDNRYGAQTLSLKVHGGGDGDLAWHGGMLIDSYDGEDFQGFGTRLAGRRDFGGVDASLYVLDGGVRSEHSNGTALEAAAYAWWSDSLLDAGRTTFDFESAVRQRRAGVHASYEKRLVAARTELAAVLGVESLAVDSARTRNYDLGGALTLDAENPAAGADRRIWSATFEGTTHGRGERWRIVYGARLDDYSDFGREVSPRLGVIWHPRRHEALKLLYGSAFRAPTANDLNGTAGLIEANPALDPERVDTLELVAMHEGEHWHTQASAFRSKWSDGIVSVANPGGTAPFVFRNLERNTSRGLTWQLGWQNEPWQLDVGASWVRSKNDTLEQPYDAFPAYIVDAQIGYRHAASRTRFYAVQHWQLDADDVFPPSAGIAAEPLPQYSRTDIGAVHALGARTELRTFVRNLFDRANYLPSSAGSRGGIPDYGRILSAEVAFRF